MKKTYKKEDVILKSFREITKTMRLKDKLNILEEWMLDHSKKEEFEIAALLKKEKKYILFNETKLLNKIYFNIKYFIEKLLNK